MNPPFVYSHERALEAEIDGLYEQLARLEVLSREHSSHIKTMQAWQLVYGRERKLRALIESLHAELDEMRRRRPVMTEEQAIETLAGLSDVPIQCKEGRE